MVLGDVVGCFPSLSGLKSQEPSPGLDEKYMIDRQGATSPWDYDFCFVSGSVIRLR
jgi:hypothetical protein